VEIFTIGFAQKNAAAFFGTLRDVGVRRLLDIRLNNTSQLAGYTKKEDLPFFLREICGAEYVHEPLLAPTQGILDAFKKQKGSWADYERAFGALIAERRIENCIDRRLFDEPTVMLCSEPTPEHCHRRLVAEYLRDKWGDIEIIHL
jgi:uncharacterized protein (DUF488 family)